MVRALEIALYVGLLAAVFGSLVCLRGSGVGGWTTRWPKR